MANSAAYDRFISSMQLTYDKWHDGEGYDVDAIAEMTLDERESLVDVLTGREVTWREIEALAAIDSTRARAAVESASTNVGSADTRLAAAEAKHRAGGASPAKALARQIRELSEVGDGLTRALLMAEEHPTDEVKRALLYASSRPTEAAMHCGALLCMLTGVTDEPFDWDLRPLFLRLAPDNGESDRKAAFHELCALVKMRPDE